FLSTPSPSFLLYPHHYTQPLHSFPTRRSSDLRPAELRRASSGQRSVTATSALSTRAPSAARSRPPRSSPPRTGYSRSPTRASARDRKSTRLNSSHDQISYAVFCLKKKKKPT